MQPATSTKPDERLFSLKWRALIIFSLLLLGIASFSTYTISRNLFSQFEQERQTIYARHVKELSGIVHQSSDSLVILAETTPFMVGAAELFLDNGTGSSANDFGDFWQSLPPTAGIDFAQTYGAASSLVQSWNSAGVVPPAPELIQGYVKEVNRMEQPVTFLDCTNLCIQFAAAPMLVKGRSAGVVVLGSTLVGEILSFRDMTGVDIGILNVLNNGATKVPEDPRNIGGWHVRVSALTNMEQNLPLLRSLADQYSLTGPGAGLRKTFNGHEYEIHLVPAEKFAVRGNAYIVMIEDITHSLAQVSQGVRRDLAVGLGGLILSELILLLILWGPLSRLKRTADVLPLLAQSAFGKIRQAVGGVPRNRRFRDEFDILDETLLNVTQQLEELQTMIARRTAALQEANKELEGFSYSVSHDLRTPLRAIDGFSRILLEEYADKLDDEGKRLLNVVRDNTNRMARLIDDILQFSRTGRLEINVSEVDMEAMAHAVHEELQLSVDVGKLQLNIGHLPRIRGDRAMLRQVLVNLVANAIKFSRARATPVVEVGGSIEGDEAVYFVRDNGVGFDMQYVNKLFGVFQRLHAIDEFEGTGIGLAIVKRIITRHGGRVWAEGKPNEGATIYFALPTTGKWHD